MRRSILFLGLLAAACAAPSAQASIQYQYVMTDQPGNSSLVWGADGKSATLQLAVGQTYTANVYLQETIDGVVNTSSFIQSQNGLLLAGFKVSRTAGDGTVTLAGNQADLPNGFNPNGTVGGTPTGSPDATLTEGFLVTPKLGVQPQANGNVFRVLLGTVTFKNNGADSSYTLTARTGLNNSTKTFLNNIGLDTDTAAGANNPAFSGARDIPFTVVVSGSTTAVPEPSSILLGSLAVFGGGFGYVRRRFGKTQQAA